MKVIVVSGRMQEEFEGNFLSVKRKGSDAVPIIQVINKKDETLSAAEAYLQTGVLAEFKEWEFWTIKGQEDDSTKALKEIQNLLACENPSSEKLHFIAKELHKLGMLDETGIPPKEGKFSSWEVAKQLARVTDLGVDEAHDVVKGWVKKHGPKLSEEAIPPEHEKPIDSTKIQVDMISHGKLDRMASWPCPLCGKKVERKLLRSAEEGKFPEDYDYTFYASNANFLLRIIEHLGSHIPYTHTLRPP